MMKLSHTAVVSRVVCSHINWMIEVGQRCKKAQEVELTELTLDAGGTAFINRLATNERMEIIHTADGITLRRS